jgi:hypothetical protein
LDTALHLPTPLIETVRELAHTHPVILVIDQLDALAALMDQHTNRLSVVVSVLQRLRDTPNVHLVVSCRKFDYKYDTRLASLKAHEVSLADLSFEGVRPLIESSGLSTASWPNDMREMLRNPQHLNLFLTTFAAEPVPQVFETYQAMLDATFQKRVIEQGTAATVAACEEIASDMNESEELWVGRSKYDQRYPHEVDRLIASGLLEADGRRIGFRHQTIFDFVRTRAFCTGTRSLADFVLDRQDAVFVRSLAWAGFHSLRVCSFERYSDEFEKVWSSHGLRNHLRWLFITFLGQIPDPHLREVQWLLSRVDETPVRSKVLQAVIGNSAWFEKLKSRLPQLMMENEQLLQWQLILLFRAALKFDRPFVLGLLRQYWASPEHDALVLQTFYDFTEWDEQTTNVVEAILARQPVNPHFVVHFAEKAAEKQSGFGSRIFVAALRLAVGAATQPVVADESAGDADDEEPPSSTRARSSLRSAVDSNDWYGIEGIATAEPAEFSQAVFPLVKEIAAALASPPNPKIVQYQRSLEIDLADELRHSQGNFFQALKLAFQKFPEIDPDGFELFAHKFASSDLLVVHRLLAYGLERLACAKPAAVLAYLLADQRRLTLGPYSDQHLESKMLIAAVAKQLNTAQLAPLADAIAKFRMYPDIKHNDVQTRWHRRRWNRQQRLRLLRAFPRERLSESLQRQRDEEEIALPGTFDYDSRIEGGLVGSPVSAKQMDLASDRDIVNLFQVLQDGTRMSHPRSPLIGGSHQASQEFANFAKEHPARAIHIIAQFQPGAQELPAAMAINSLAECEAIKPEQLFDVIKELARRGFGSEDFKTSCAWALEKLARRGNGVPDELCSLLKSWIVPVAASPPQEPDEEEESWPKLRKPEEEKQPQSLLWSLGGGGILPHGNYPLLRALELGYYCRKPLEIDGWLEVLQQHLTVPEDLSVWRSLVREFAVLGVADRTGALKFITAFFDQFPQLLAEYEGVLFLARSMRWLPSDFLKASLITIDGSAWEFKDQAIGELAMLRIAIDPTDEYCRSVVEDALSAVKSASAEGKRLGLAFACVNLWMGPSFRKTCHEVLMRLAGLDDEHLPAALMDVFRLGSIPPDHKTKELLRVVADMPELIRRGRPSLITDRIKELLAEGFDATLLADITRTLLDAVGSDIADIRTSWAADAGDLIEISITLQRLPTTRSAGLWIFEALLDAGAYEASQLLKELDRRPI